MTDEMIDPEKLEMLETEVARLPRSIEPPRAAWSGIRAAIEREPVTPINESGSRRLRFWQQPAFLAAAAAALVAATSVTTMVALRDKPAPEQKIGAASPVASAPFTQFVSRESRYIETANQLQALVESDQSTLAPETIVKLKQSLAIIDAAIAEARAALAADPANKELAGMLSSSYDKKLDLLRRSAAMGRS